MSFRSNDDLTHMSTVLDIGAGRAVELRCYWPAVLACFVTAVFGWGFGFTGPSVYLAELQRVHGWSTGRIAAAITAYYLLGALCLARVDVALRWFEARCVVASGIVLLGLGASLFARSRQPWELYVAAVPMALGWAGCTSTAISTTLARYFHRQRVGDYARAQRGQCRRLYDWASARRAESEYRCRQCCSFGGGGSARRHPAYMVWYQTCRCKGCRGSTRQRRR